MTTTTAPDAPILAGTNVTLRRDGDLLIVTIDTTQDHGPSASGKTHICATTRGFVPVPECDGLRLNLTAIRKATP